MIGKFENSLIEVYSCLKKNRDIIIDNFEDGVILRHYIDSVIHFCDILITRELENNRVLKKPERAYLLPIIYEGYDKALKVISALNAGEPGYEDYYIKNLGKFDVEMADKFCLKCDILLFNCLLQLFALSNKDGKKNKVFVNNVKQAVYEEMLGFVRKEINN